MRVAITGHRPEDCVSEDDVRLKSRVKLQYPNKTGKKVSCVITGMAAGTDLWAADEAIKLGLDVVAARPWQTHTARTEDAELYQRVLGAASKIVVVTDVAEYPGPYVYHKRNEWMVDNAEVVMAYLNPASTKGGTFACVQYALKVGKPIANIYADPPF